MRIIVDSSDYQAGADWAAVARAVDAGWSKAGDYAYVSRYGWPADDVIAAAFAAFVAAGCQVGSYFFPRPGWTSPEQQVDEWRQHTPSGFSVVPMIDLEVPGTLSGSDLTSWVARALIRAQDQFGMMPVLYWSAAFQSGNGMGLPDAVHTPMVAEYHRGYTPFLWANKGTGWEQYAYSAYGGPDVPRGYNLTPRDLIWQFTSSAQIPGFAGLVDCSFVPEAAWAQITSTGTGPPAGGGFLMALSEQEQVTIRDQLAALTSTVTGATWSGTPRLIEMEARVNALWDAITGTTSEGDPRWKVLEARTNATYQNVAAIGDAVAKLSASGIDTAALAKDIASQVGLDPAKLAEALRLAAALILTPAAPPTPPAALAVEPVVLPDVDPDTNTAGALAALASITGSVFDPELGIAARLGREAALMEKATEGNTAADIEAATKRHLADIARKAGLAAQLADLSPDGPPPAPEPAPDAPDVAPEPTPAGDMAGTPPEEG